MKLYLAITLCLFAVGVFAVPTKTGRSIKPTAKVNPNAPKGTPKIVGGIEASATPDSHEFPHAVSVQFNNGYFCTGQIIHESWIMTAGHCCDGVAASTYFITVGAHNWRNPDDGPGGVDQYSSVVTVQTVVQHEDYNGAAIMNDICVLKLTEPLTFVKGHIEAAVLATNETSIDDTVGSPVYPCGWGKTSDDLFASVSDVLMKTTDVTISDQACKDIYDIEFDAGEICIDVATGHGTCNGDSGGPMNTVNIKWNQDPENNYKWVTQGITSYGASAGCLSGLPDAFTDVAFYNGGESAGQQGEYWINKATNGDVGEVDPNGRK